MDFLAGSDSTAGRIDTQQDDRNIVGLGPMPQLRDHRTRGGNLSGHFHNRDAFAEAPK